MAPTGRPIEFGIQTNLHQTTFEEVLATWQVVEREGLDHAWTYDHLMPLFSNPEGPNLEGWTTLAALMAQVPRIRAGVLVPCNPFRPPIVTAKMAVTVDQLSEGRLEMALGAGWWEPEFRHYGIEWAALPERLAQMDEAIQVMQSLWTQDRTTFEGTYYTIRDAPFQPKPVQQPHLPLWIGGRGKKYTLRMAAKYADGWNVWTLPREDYAERLALLDQYCEQEGRDPKSVRRSLAARMRIDTSSEAARAAMLTEATASGEELPEGFEELINQALAGSPEEIAEQVGAFAALGVDHIVLLMDPPFDQEGLTRFAREVVPLVRAAGL